MFHKSALVTIFLLGFTVRFARGLPPDQYIKVAIHETPTDPESDIAFTTELVLTPDEQSGNSIGWKVLVIKIQQFDSGSVSDTWVDQQPTVTGGLWWIEHADPDRPTDDEFVILPEIIGTAEPYLWTETDLDYDVAGTEYDPPEPPETPPFANTGSLDTEFWIVGESEAELDVTDTPASVAREEDPPITG